MAQLDETQFTAYVFTDEEILEACVFTDLQEKHIQTEIARYAQQQITATAEGMLSPEEFVRAHEYRRGLMGSLQYLLEMSKACKDARNAMVEARIVKQAADLPTLDPQVKG